jgi:hypothetical protein
VHTTERVEHARLSSYACAVLIERPRADKQQLADVDLEVFRR